MCISWKNNHSDYYFFIRREYLAIFKKTVAMHENFLTRLARHPVFRNDHNFKVFLEYDKDLSVRSKNKMEVLEVRRF